MAAIVLGTWTHSSLATCLPMLYVSRGLSPGQGSAMLAVYLFSGSVGPLLGATVADRWGRRAVTLYSSLLATPALLGFVAWRGWPGLLLLVVTSLALYAPFSASIVHAQELLPQRPALAAGLIMGFAWAVASLGLALTGSVADRWGLEAALGTVAWLPLLAAVILLWVPETLPRRVAPVAAGQGATAPAGR